MRTITLSVALLLCCVPCWGLNEARAQQSQPPRRVAVLLVGFSPQSAGAQAFRDGLRDAGYAEGRDVVLQWHSAEGNYARVPSLVAEIVRAKPEVIVVDSTIAVSEAKRATSTIPIVIAVAADPVASGLLDSLAHPGGNVTGLSMMMPDLVTKRLQLTKECLPRLQRMGVLQDPSVPWHANAVRNLSAFAKAMGIEVTLASVEKPADFDGAFSALRRNDVEALYVLENAFFATQRDAILGFAARSRLPSIYGGRLWAERGALLSYSADYSEMFRRAAGYVDKILKGANPGDLPMEQPTKFELVVNLKTAKALGLKIPQSILIQANEVIR